MTKPAIIKPDPKLDLVLERVIDVPPELVWKAWTTPEHLLPWFCPKPWTTIDVEIDLRPGGIFRSVMRSPEGKEFPNVGCYLEVVPFERLTWTDALLPGYRPSPEPFFTAVLTLEPPAKARATSQPPSTATRREARSTRRWASTKAGARSSTSWWSISRRRCDPQDHRFKTARRLAGRRAGPTRTRLPATTKRRKSRRMKYLVTGSSGHLGEALVRVLPRTRAQTSSRST